MKAKHRAALAIVHVQRDGLGQTGMLFLARIVVKGQNIVLEGLCERFDGRLAQSIDFALSHFKNSGASILFFSAI